MQSLRKTVCLRAATAGARCSPHGGKELSLFRLWQQLRISINPNRSQVSCQRKLCNVFVCFRKRKHLNHFPHKCAQCPKQFFTRQELEAHIRTHTGEKPYSCQQCSKSFARIHHLRRHIDTVHSEKTKVKTHERVDSQEYEDFEKTETHIEVR